MDLSKATWRKTTDINRGCAVFELVHGGVVLLDVGFSDDDAFEIAFHEGISNTIADWDSFFRVLEYGRKIAVADK